LNSAGTRDCLGCSNFAITPQARINSLKKTPLWQQINFRKYNQSFLIKITANLFSFVFWGDWENALFNALVACFKVTFLGGKKNTQALR